MSFVLLVGPIKVGNPDHIAVEDLRRNGFQRLEIHEYADADAFQP
jgi:hypothetical protein